MKRGLIKKKKNTKKALCSHLIIFFILSGINIWDRLNNLPRFPYNFLYLTQINLYIDTIYFLLCLFIDIAKKDSKKYYHQLFNFCFTLSFIVFIMYWSMFFIKKDTLYKEGLQPNFILAVLLHGGVFIFNLLEQIFIQKRKSPKYCNPIIYFVFTILYIGGLSLLYYLFDIRVYPFIYGSFLSFFIVCIGGILTSLLGHKIYTILSKPKKKLDLKDDIGGDTDESLNSYNEV